MNKYQYSQKLNVDAAKLNIEIVGVFPASQPFIANISGEVVYNVKINGIAAHLKESVLDQIVNSETAKDTPEQATVETVDIEARTITESPPARRGRKPKLKTEDREKAESTI